MIHFLPKTILHLIGKVLESTVIFSNEDKEIVDNGSEAMENGAADTGPSVDPTSLLYCERFAEFLIDLLSQLPTRRYPADFYLVTSLPSSGMFPCCIMYLVRRM
jgi:hypothetical protein